MFPPDAETEVRLSILDRLTDLHPDSKNDLASNAWDTLRGLKASFCRDLADLLNTRRAEQVFDPKFDQSDCFQNPSKIRPRGS